MGTIAQELTRIQNAKADLKTSIENKGVQVPANTLIDGYPALVDQISGGGGDENLYMTQTDVSCLFNERDLANEKILDGLKRFSQNEINKISYAFEDATLNTSDAEINAKVKQYLEGLFNHNIYLASYAFSGAYINVSDLILDFSNLNFAKNGGASYMFSRFNNSTQGQGPYVKIKINSRTFDGLQTVEKLSQNGKVDFMIDENKLYLTNVSTSFDYMFGGNSTIRNSFFDYNGVKYNDFYFYFSDAASAMAKSAEGFLRKNNGLKNIYFNDTSKITTFELAFEGCTELQSLHNINLSGLYKYSTEQFLSGSTMLTNFGELELVSGSTLGNYLTTFKINKIWNATQDTVRNGQTIGYWFEEFANALGNKTKSGNQTITINATLYNSLTAEQKALITDKGYLLASAS